jgi:hypothetical protein
MALQLGALRHALIEAGASEQSADKASEALASYENRLANMDSRLAVLTWIGGTNIVLTCGVLWRLLSIH